MMGGTRNPHVAKITLEPTEDGRIETNAGTRHTVRRG